jgi:hypothetical protein
LPQYANARSKQEKSEIVSLIYNSIQEATPEGGFIRKNARGEWCRVPSHIAREKVGWKSAFFWLGCCVVTWCLRLSYIFSSLSLLVRVAFPTKGGTGVSDCCEYQFWQHLVSTTLKSRVCRFCRFRDLLHTEYRSSTKAKIKRRRERLYPPTKAAEQSDRQDEQTNATEMLPLSKSVVSKSFSFDTEPLPLEDGEGEASLLDGCSFLSVASDENPEEQKQDFVAIENKGIEPVQQIADATMPPLVSPIAQYRENQRTPDVSSRPGPIYSAYRHQPYGNYYDHHEYSWPGCHQHQSSWRGRSFRPSTWRTPSSAPDEDANPRPGGHYSRHCFG